MRLAYRPATLADLDVVYQYEKESYHPDEAASRQQLERRINYSAESDPFLFTVAIDTDKNKIVAFLCNTLTNEDLVTEESMKHHDYAGSTICLHSVCVAPDRRHEGIATKLMMHWVDQIKKNKAGGKQYKRITLLSRPSLVGFYESVGFKSIGISKVVHGPEPWVDCILDL
ncbi:acyl-CoA N-acyltransferase [Pilobolus umbonatus]|nr:acyl-CoA N-acyltransferase [Pilobolus umbonatus]